MDSFWDCTVCRTSNYGIGKSCMRCGVLREGPTTLQSTTLPVLPQNSSSHRNDDPSPHSSPSRAYRKRSQQTRHVAALMKSIERQCEKLRALPKTITPSTPKSLRLPHTSSVYVADSITQTQSSEVVGAGSDHHGTDDDESFTQAVQIHWNRKTLHMPQDVENAVSDYVIKPHTTTPIISPSFPSYLQYEDKES
eukprot:PhF_6_TR29085/c0_g1_i3/m.42409